MIRNGQNAKLNNFIKEDKMKKNKIPKWWYAGFDKNFFYECYVFIKSWFWSYGNPIWSIRDKIKGIKL